MFIKKWAKHIEITAEFFSISFLVSKHDRIASLFKAAAVRAVRTVAQTAVSLLGGNMIGIMDADWVAVASVSAMAGVVSILTSVAGLPEVKVDES